MTDTLDIHTLINLEKFPDVDIDTIRKFIAVYAFLLQNPISLGNLSKYKDYLPNKTIKNLTSLERENLAKLNLNDKDFVTRLATKYFKSRAKGIVFKECSTVPDPMVDVILKGRYGYSEEEVNRISNEHRQAMVAENIIGELLELYLASVLENHGWIWCSANIARSIDFIKEDVKSGGWALLQVKNRDNSENSSSADIRRGTQIEKWFRSFSRKTGTNWENFPEKNVNFTLSEEDFRVFAIHTIENLNKD